MNRRTREQSEGKTAKDQQTHLVPEGTVADIWIVIGLFGLLIAY